MMPKNRPANREETASGPTNSGGPFPAAAARTPLPELLKELVQLLAEALARRWIEQAERDCESRSRPECSAGDPPQERRSPGPVPGLPRR